MSKSQLQESFSSERPSISTNEQSVIWTQLIQKVLCFLPESERPSTTEAVDEISAAIEESLKCNGDFNGCRIPAPFSTKFAKHMFENWMPERGDVLIASYPKTGSQCLNC